MKSNILYLFLMPFLLTSCLRSLEDEGVHESTIYMGCVIDNSNEPLSGISVKITNGKRIHNHTKTNSFGVFELSAKMSDIDGKYYIQVGDDEATAKKSSLKGFGQKTYNYGNIPFVNTNLPNVQTVRITAITLNSFTIECNVLSEGASAVTERGLCWGTNIPTTNDNKKPMGLGLGKYSCSVDGVNISNTKYYARAYAINDRGISYGETIEISSQTQKYYTLPTVEYAGYLYHIHPDLGAMPWKDGFDACDNLSAYGYDDWFLPNRFELMAIASSIDLPLVNGEYWAEHLEPISENTHSYYVAYNSNWSNWIIDHENAGNLKHIIPVRKDKL